MSIQSIPHIIRTFILHCLHKGPTSASNSNRQDCGPNCSSRRRSRARSPPLYLHYSTIASDWIRTALYSTLSKSSSPSLFKVLLMVTFRQVKGFQGLDFHSALFNLGNKLMCNFRLLFIMCVYSCSVLSPPVISLPVLREGVNS